MGVITVICWLSCFIVSVANTYIYFRIYKNLGEKISLCLPIFWGCLALFFGYSIISSLIL